MGLKLQSKGISQLLRSFERTRSSLKRWLIGRRAKRAALFLAYANFHIISTPSREFGNGGETSFTMNDERWTLSIERRSNLKFNIQMSHVSCKIKNAEWTPSFFVPRSSFFVLRSSFLPYVFPANKIRRSLRNQFVTFRIFVSDELVIWIGAQ